MRWTALETVKAEARDIVYTRKEVDSSLAAQDEKIKLLLAKLEEQSREIEELKAKVTNSKTPVCLADRGFILRIGAAQHG